MLLPNEVIGVKEKVRPEEEEATAATATAALAVANGQEVEEEFEEDEFEEEALEGFQKIYADVQEQYGEAFYLLGQSGPLFSTINDKSSLDPREYNIPAPFKTTRALPFDGPAAAYQMSFISPKISAVPHPAVPPTEFMSGFVHPGAISLPLPKFTETGSFKSYAPTINQSTSVIDETLVNTVWYEQYTKQALKSQKEIDEILKARANEISQEGNGHIDVEMKDLTTAEPVKEVNTSTTESTNEDSKEAEKLDQEVQDSESQDTPKTSVDEETGVSENDIDFLNTLTWAPDHFIDDDEIEAAKNGTEQELISKLLLQLQNAQRERLSRSDSTAYIIPQAEKRLATKIQNMLARLVSETSPKDLDIKPSGKYPVLQAAYPGVLPASEPRHTGFGINRPTRYTPKKYRK